MTTDKIRAAAQKLLDALYDHRFIPGAKWAATDALRAALAEPAQAAPAGDTVPVVAQVSTAVSLRPGRPPELLWFGPDIGLQPADYLVSQRGHLAAMEALRRENERLKADRSDQVAEVLRLVDEAMRYSGAAGDWMHEDTYAAVEAAVRRLAGEA